MNIFEEVRRTNLAYCASMGLSSAELYGTPLSDEEEEVHKLMRLGVPAEAAIPRVVEKYRNRFGGDITQMTIARLRIERAVRQTRAKYINCYPATPFERLAKVEAKAKIGGAA